MTRPDVCGGPNDRPGRPVRAACSAPGWRSPPPTPSHQAGLGRAGLGSHPPSYKSVQKPGRLLDRHVAVESPLLDPTGGSWPEGHRGQGPRRAARPGLQTPGSLGQVTVPQAGWPPQHAAALPEKQDIPSQCPAARQDGLHPSPDAREGGLPPPGPAVLGLSFLPAAHRRAQGRGARERLMRVPGSREGLCPEPARAQDTSC